MAKIKKQKKPAKKYSLLRITPETNKQLKFLSEKSSMYVIDIIAELVKNKIDRVS